MRFPVTIMNIDLQELRNWISFILLVIAGAVAIRTYVLNQRQRRLENSFRLLDLCNKTLTNEDLLHWHTIHVASSEQAGARSGFFVDEKKQQVPFSELFSPNIIAQQSIERFCELFNLVCYEYLNGAVDIRLFYFEYGQYMIPPTTGYLGLITAQSSSSHIIPIFTRRSRKTSCGFCSYHIRPSLNWNDT